MLNREEHFVLLPHGSSSRMQLCPCGKEQKRRSVLDLRYLGSRGDPEYLGRSMMELVSETAQDTRNE